MNESKKPAYTPTRVKRLEQEIETLQQARDRAIEAAAKNRLVAELALTALLPGLNVEHCDAADLEAIQDFVTATDHLKEMSDADPLTLIRSLLESMDSIELQYINAAQYGNWLRERIAAEFDRVSAIKSILSKINLQDPEGRKVKQINTVLCCLGWAIYESPSESFSAILSERYSIADEEVDAEITRIIRTQNGKESATDDPKNQTSEMSPMSGPGESSGDPRKPVPLQ